MVTDGLSNTLAASEGLIGHGQMRSCLSPGSAVSDPITGTYSPTNVPAPGPASIAALTYQTQSCGAKTGKAKAGGPIGHTRWCDGGVYYSGFTTAITPNSRSDGREPGHRLLQRRRGSCRWTGTRLTRTTAARPTWP